MRKRYLYGLIWVLTVLTALTGCEDMIYREVDFQGETEPEMLVVTGKWSLEERPTALVSHSYFFNRTDKRKNDWISDAQVSVRVNGHPYDLSWQSDNNYANDSMPRLRAGDTVEITASHPDYQAVRAQLVMPGQIHCTVSKTELMPNHQIAFQLDFDAYEGNEDDVIGILADGVIEGSWTTTYGAQKTKTEEYQLHTVYSNDIVFAEAENASTQGYFGATSGYLYFPASKLKEPRRIQLFVDTYQLQGARQYDSVEAKLLLVQASALTYSAYRFDVSMRSIYYDDALPPPTGLPYEENIMEQIMVAIQSMLGDQEPKQVYTNVENGLGHVEAESVEYHFINFY